ncbi:MAG: UDP-N-acetylmuramate dehydrogenase, partial [Geobacteraceae bacterium]|nr:UDP-N-acetylmuramate dehydrogenase [Geobacteraceae bacterium]
MNRPHGEIRRSFRGDLLVDEPLARHTSLRVGGGADLLAVPADLDDLRGLLRILAERGTASLVIGGGYNLLVRDGGFRGVAISLTNFRGLEELPDSLLSAGAGVSNGALVRFAEERRLAGLEFLIGIPGTVGGALCMNAGAHGEAILDRLATLTTLHGREVRTRVREELDYGYRFLRLDPGEIIVAAAFRLAEGNPAEIEERIEGFLAHRRNAQRVRHPNAGSFFKNPEGEQAWRLIEAAGLRGQRIGEAQVSEVHANFLVNRGGAT